MAILDMQGMEAADRCGHGGGNQASTLSLLLCASEASVNLCL
ncbi:MAG: SapB/AmfS family lanthipeptide [Nocardiopsaceae bacterium]|nr:SapB/AmfS family lanthipeptide [Nocardiopsaceae bacterium]